MKITPRLPLIPLGTALNALLPLILPAATITDNFSIKNTGTTALKGLAIGKDGAHAGDFVVMAPGKTSLAPGVSTTFKVVFNPGATGTRNASIHIRSNDTNENPFDITVSGMGVK